MALIRHPDESPDTHPLDVIEHVVVANDWSFDRSSDQEMVVHVSGQWCDYSLHFAWHEGAGAMHFTCAFDMRVPVEKRSPVYELLALINERINIGHFCMVSEYGLPMFRHALLLRGAGGPSVEQMEDLMETAINECERFYPSFQYVIWGGKTAAEAFDLAIIEPVGQA